MIQTLKKNWLFVLGMTWGIWWILTRAVESLKICFLMGWFCRKYVIFELNSLWFQKWYKEFGKFSQTWLNVLFDKSSVYNVLTEEIYFWTKVAHRISTFWTFHSFSEVVQISHVIFETRRQFLYKLCTIL